VSPCPVVTVEDCPEFSIRIFLSGPCIHVLFFIEPGLVIRASRHVAAHQSRKNLIYLLQVAHSAFTPLTTSLDSLLRHCDFATSNFVLHAIQARVHSIIACADPPHSSLTERAITVHTDSRELYAAQFLPYSFPQLPIRRSPRRRTRPACEVLSFPPTQ